MLSLKAGWQRMLPRKVSKRNNLLWRPCKPYPFTYLRDPKDEPYINLAIEVSAAYLISRDNDLLDLMKWNQEEGCEFQKRFRALRIVTPEGFLCVMEQSAP
jgi:predicted nucleic acid-binding protein